MEPAWVIGLGWSHAMFILVLEELKKNSNDLSTELY
jgi:GH15 family glucan-1,4-alpha-glucosidase